MSFAVRSAWVIGVLVVVLAEQASADEGVALKWKFEQGQVSYYTSSQDMKINVKQGIVAQELLMKQTSDVRWEVESVDDDGNAHITQTIQRIRSESGPAEDTVTFDSQDDQPPKDVDESSIEALRAGINQPIYLVLDPRGKVLDVRLSEQFAQKIKESPQYGPLAMMFSRENLKQMASVNTIELPDEPVTKGSTWEQESTLADPIAGKQKLTTTYRYDGAEEHDGRRLDKISASAKISPADEKKPALVTVKDQKLNGVIWFDRGAGRIDEMQMTIKMVSEAVAGANKIEQIMITKLHTKLVDKPADAESKPKPKKNAAKAEDL